GERPRGGGIAEEEGREARGGAEEAQEVTPPSAPVDPLTGIEAARFGIYVHFPYCLSKCPYCDFASTAAKEVPEARYARALRREHDGPTAVRAYQAARAAGFQNVSLDFIYGVHGQSLEQVAADARQAAALQPDHLSAYALTLDKEALAEEVPLAKQLARGE